MRIWKQCEAAGIQTIMPAYRNLLAQKIRRQTNMHTVHTTYMLTFYRINFLFYALDRRCDANVRRKHHWCWINWMTSSLSVSLSPWYDLLFGFCSALLLNCAVNYSWPGECFANIWKWPNFYVNRMRQKKQSFWWFLWLWQPCHSLQGRKCYPLW